MSIKNAYNNWANIYDTNKNRTRDLDQIATQSILKDFPFQNVLELGCGTGKNTTFLLSKATSIIGFDFSNEMMKKAKEKINNKKVQFIKQDLNLDWNISNQSVDLITCSLTLEHIENIQAIFHKAFHKLQINGYLFICELHPFKQYTGTKARYETDDGIEILETYTHHITEYLSCAKKSHLSLIDLQEWFDGDAKDEIPRLISFVFQKS